MGRSSLTGIPRDHFKTLRDSRDHTICWRDVALQVGVPLVLAAMSLWWGWKLPDATGVITAVSIVAALLCAMAVFIFQLRIDMVHDNRLDEEDFEMVNESFHNVMWAILVGLGIAIMLVVADAAGGLNAKYWGEIITAAVIALSVHFLTVIAMCLKRLRRSFERVAMRKE